LRWEDNGHHTGSNEHWRREGGSIVTEEQTNPNVANSSITMYGTAWCQDCKRAKQFFGEHRVAYAFIDVDEDAKGLGVVEKHNDGKHVIPTIVFADGSVLVEPSNVALAAKLGLQTHPECSFYDLVVVGGGPAGLTAALYTAREGIDTLVVERSAPGGQAAVTELLDNYPGFPDGISGAEFADRLVAQSRRFGVEILSVTEARSVSRAGQYLVVKLADGDEVRANAVLLAPGASYRRLGIPNEDTFIGAGVHFCATCDGPFYRDQDVLVVGGGSSAAEGALFLAKFAGHVTLAVRGNTLSASQLAQSKVLNHPKISVRLNTVLKEFRGDRKLRSVMVRNVQTGKDEEIKLAAVFVFVGLEPATQFVRGVIDLDAQGFVLTGQTMETSQPGVFAAGDARLGSSKQLVSAAGEGAAAALMIRQYLQALRAVSAAGVEQPELAEPSLTL
jgi:thioredoxin reductase (NADPH)